MTNEKKLIITATLLQDKVDIVVDVTEGLDTVELTELTAAAVEAALEYNLDEIQKNSLNN
jgi:hypothetical protein